MAEYIKADTGIPIETVTPANGQEFTLQEMNAFVEGYLEAIPLTADLIMYVNEEGIRLEKPVNSRATMKLWEYRPDWRSTSILGDVLIASLAETGDSEQEDAGEEDN